MILSSMAQTNNWAISSSYIFKDGAAFIGFMGQVLSSRPGVAFGSLIPPFYEL